MLGRIKLGGCLRIASGFISVLGKNFVFPQFIVLDITIGHETQSFGGILKKDYKAYYKEREVAVAYQLGEVTLYDEPMRLKDLGLDYVPQSFAYIKS
jgi:predicted transcriptional regulator